MRIRWSTRTAVGLAPLALLLVASQACGPPARDAPRGWGGADARGDTFVLQVENQNFNEARLYQRWNGERRRFGNVVGNQSETFTLRWQAGQFRLEVDFVAAGGFISDAVPVSPGDTLVFRIPAGAR